MYVYVFVHVCMCYIPILHTYMSVFVHICMCLYIYVCVTPMSYTCLYMYAYTYLYMYAYIRIRIYYTCICTYTGGRAKAQGSGHTRGSSLALPQHRPQSGPVILDRLIEEEYDDDGANGDFVFS